MKLFRLPLFRPLLYSSIVCVLICAITLFIANEQKQLRREQDAEELVRAMNRAKDKFKDILYADIDVANSLGIIYKRFGIQNNYDSIASDLLGQSQYAEVLQLTVNGVVTNVYPIAGYENTIGISVASDSLRQKEYRRAKEKKEIFFAGPRALRAGGTGILGKFPVIIGDSVQALVTVLTKMETIQRTMQVNGDSSKTFSYQLVKTVPGADTTQYFLSETRPSSSSAAFTTEIPEGDWILSVSYRDGYESPPLPVSTLVTGFGIAVLGFFMVFRIFSQNFLLGKKVQEKTLHLRERIKELSTIYKVSTLLQDEHADISQLMMDVANVLPPGWQYPESCAAQVKFDGQVYSSSGYKTSVHTLRADFQTADDRSGSIEILYTADKPNADEGPFLREERELLNTLADQLVAYLNKRHSQESKARYEAQFRAGFEHAAIGMALVSLDGRWISVNHALCTMIGYNEDELMRATVSEITHPEDRNVDIDNFARSIKGEFDFFRREKRDLHKNGSIVWININVALIREKSQPLYFVGQIENITEKLEADLKFRNLVEKSMVGVYIIQDNRFAYINPKIIEQSEYSETELLNMKVEEFVHPDDVRRVSENIDKRMSGDVEGIRYDVRAYSKNGNLLWLEMFGNTTMYQGKPAIIGTMVDVTDKKRAFNDLANSEANLRTVFDTTRVSYMLLNDKLEIITANHYFSESYRKQTGLNLTIGTYFPDQVLPHRREIIARNCNEVLETGRTVFDESAYPNEDGSFNYFDSTYTPIIVNQKVIGLCYSGMDVTSRKRSEVERQNLLAERLRIIEDLTRRNRDLEQFSYIVSHNVRGPVATISGLTNIATSEIFPIEDRVKAMQSVQISTNNLETVLKDLNEVLAVRKGDAELKADISLPEVMETSKVMLKDLFDKHNPEIICNFNSSATVYGIRSYVQNIFYNMLSNAIKYSKHQTTPEINISTSVSEEGVHLHFRDNGLGIDLEKHSEHLFGLYKRFHLASDGKGMGLFMAKTQVESMGGKITVESTPNNGTHFTITFRKASEIL